MVVSTGCLKFKDGLKFFNHFRKNKFWRVLQWEDVLNLARARFIYTTEYACIIITRKFEPWQSLQWGLVSLATLKRKRVL